MPSRTISLDLDAYEKLRRSKRPGESFSSVIRRAQILEAAPTGVQLLAFYRGGGSGVNEAYLDTVEAAILNDPPPDDPWE